MGVKQKHHQGKKEIKWEKVGRSEKKNGRVLFQDMGAEEKRGNLPRKSPSSPGDGTPMKG